METKSRVSGATLNKAQFSETPSTRTRGYLATPSGFAQCKKGVHDDCTSLAKRLAKQSKRRYLDVPKHATRACALIQARA